MKVFRSLNKKNRIRMNPLRVKVCALKIPEVQPCLTREFTSVDASLRKTHKGCVLNRTVTQLYKKNNGGRGGVIFFMVVWNH